MKNIIDFFVHFSVSLILFTNCKSPCGFAKFLKIFSLFYFPINSISHILNQFEESPKFKCFRKIKYSVIFSKFLKILCWLLQNFPNVWIYSQFSEVWSLLTFFHLILSHRKSSSRFPTYFKISIPFFQIF